jgi:hypothetical protein
MYARGGAAKVSRAHYINVHAHPILWSEVLRNYDFGEVDAEEVRLCEIKMKPSLKEWRYKNVGGFSLTPETVAPEEVKIDVVVEQSEEVHGAEDVAAVEDAEIPAAAGTEK